MIFRVVLRKNGRILPNLFINYASAKRMIEVNYLNAYIIVED